MQIKYKIPQTYLGMDKVTEAKNFMNNNCMMAVQVADLVKLMQMNDAQLDLAQFGFMHAYDQAMYDVVVNALSNDYDKEKLLGFIGSYGADANTSQMPSSSSTISMTQAPSVTTQSTSSPSTSSSTGGPKTTSTCTPMADADFGEALDASDEPVGEDAKMEVAKSVFDDACLTTSQVLKVVELFVSEDRRLDFAKFAFPRTSDKDKYFRINKAFVNEGRITALSNFVKQNK